MGFSESSTKADVHRKKVLNDLSMESESEGHDACKDGVDVVVIAIA